jgi:(2Fe-2S) ferredoxin
MRALLAFAAASLLALPAHALPTQVEAEYLVSTGGLTIGRVNETYTRRGDTYRIESTTRAEGVLKLFRDDTIVLTSEGRVGPKGLVPLRFEQRLLGDASRDIHAAFDWKQSQLRSEYRGERSVHALPPGTQDRLSVMYQFMNVADAGEVVRMPMSNGRKVDRYTYRKVDEPRLATPAGEFETAHYERVTESERENRAELWLARDRFNLPVRVVFQDAKGLRLEQTIVSLTTR